MDGALMPYHVTIRGHGSGRVHSRDGTRLTIECASRLLPGRPYEVQGVPGASGNCRMRVAASWVRGLEGDEGVVYRVTLQAES